MKRTNKGFTIVELVIVIAVVAILAAVLIPTFASLIEKANQSADIQAARQMNTSLAAGSAEKKPADIKEVIKILDADGFDADALKPITKGHTFYWCSADNAILLVKDDESKVLYPTDKAIVDNYAAHKDSLVDLMSGKSYIVVETATPEEARDALKNGQSVTLTDDTTFDEIINIPAGSDTTLDLGGKEFSGDNSGTGDSYRIVVKKGATLTLTNGTYTGRSIQNDGGTVIIKPDVVINAIDTNGGGCVRNNDGGTVIIEGGTFNVTGYANISNGGGVSCVYNADADGEIIIKGGTFNSVTAAYAINNVGGTMTIENADVTAFRGAIYCGTNGKVTVNGGSFEVTNGEDSGWTAIAEGNGEIIINGGEFKHVNPDHLFSGNVTKN